MGNKIGGSGSNATAGVGQSDLNQLEDPTKHTDAGNRLTANGEDGEDPSVEVPPPMQPFSSIPLKPSEPSSSGVEKVE